MAGDLLPHPTQDQLVATGFLRNSMLNEEGGVDPEQFRMDAMFDRMDAIGKSILGLTIQCAQCHNHKFDPLTQEEYYRMFAFLNSDHEASMIAYTPPRKSSAPIFCGRCATWRKGLRHETSGLAGADGCLGRFGPQQSAGVGHAGPVENSTGDNGERFYYFADNSIRAARLRADQMDGGVQDDQRHAVHRRLSPRTIDRRRSSLRRARAARSKACPP